MAARQAGNLVPVRVRLIALSKGAATRYAQHRTYSRHLLRRGIDIRGVQHLLGHASVRTTEIYIKGLLPTMVRPNETPIIASAK